MISELAKKTPKPAVMRSILRFLRRRYVIRTITKSAVVANAKPKRMIMSVMLATMNNSPLSEDLVFNRYSFLSRGLCLATKRVIQRL